MEILYLLIPLALVLVAVIVWVFMWAIRSGQFDDMEGPAHSILMDDDKQAKKTGLPEGNPETHKSQRREEF